MVELLLMGQKMDLYDYTGMLGKYICYESGVLKSNVGFKVMVLDCLKTIALL